jgi:hypothetical protein
MGNILWETSLPYNGGVGPGAQTERWGMPGRFTSIIKTANSQSVQKKHGVKVGREQFSLHSWG